MGTLSVDAGVESEGALGQYARRAPRISREDVFQAADALLIQGDRPTIDRVRMKIGRGSPNTINDHLDAWWGQLGARLRDLPGQQFPQLPERVAQSLQRLWTEALAGAQSLLQTALTEREGALEAREAALQRGATQLNEREQRVESRSGALEESLALAREQLLAANERAEKLERRVDERDAECDRLRARIETLETSAAQLRSQLDTAAAAHRVERVDLQERHAAAEQHWVLEVDRGRQQVKGLTQQHGQLTREWRAQIEKRTQERDALKEQLLGVRAQLKATHAARESLEKRLAKRASRGLRPAKRSSPAAHSRRPRSRRDPPGST